VIASIDDASLNWINERWPWSRTRIAEIVNWLADAGARVIGIDILLFDPAFDHAEDQTLVDALKNANASVSVSQIFSGYLSESYIPPLDIYQQVLDGYGISEVERDDDAVVRSIKAYKTLSQENPFITLGEEKFFNWSFEIARLYLGAQKPNLATPVGVYFGDSYVPLNQRALLINYAGPAGTYPSYSAAFIPLGDYDPDFFRDKIVLIGATSETLQDIHPTPFQPNIPMPGVEIVANAIATILTGNYLRLAPPWITILTTLFFAGLAWFIIRIQRPTVTTLVLGFLLVVYFILRQILFVITGWQITLITPGLMLFLGVMIPSLDQAVSQEIGKRRVRNLFNRFISPTMISQLLETQDINALNKRVELTILFSDIRGFTTLSEKLSPEEVVSLLNPYLDVMTRVIHKHGGTVDKYEGDAILAFFGEPIQYPDHALRAVRASFEMRNALIELTHSWEAEGLFTGKFEMGIGLNTGEVFVGLLGSETRVNYTVIGDNVNMAARIQDLTKEYDWPVLLTDSTYKQVKDEFDAQYIDSRVLRGRSEEVVLFKLLGPKGEHIQPRQSESGDQSPTENLDSTD
jgi:adenylate cyclase